MSKITKYFKVVPLAVLAAILCILCFTACGKGTGYKTLATPKNLRVENEVLMWDAVENAAGYDVEIDGQRYETEDAELNVFLITSTPKKYVMRVRAYGDLGSYNDSDWSEAVEYSLTLQEGLGVRLINNGSEYEIGVTNASKISGKFVIPQTFTDGLPITQIANDAFKGCTGLTSIFIPDSVKTIGYGAFLDCVNLTNVRLPSGLEKLDTYTFSGCTSLTKVNMPMCLEEIDREVFADCVSLKDIEIPRGVKKIGNSAFRGCKSLTALRLPDLVEKIGFIPFNGCDALVELTVDERNEVYKSEGNCLIKKSSNTLVYGIQTSVIPDCVKSIDSYAFYGCSGLTEITIPSNVKKIWDCAFGSCLSLKKVVMENGGVEGVTSPFYRCFALEEVVIPNSLTVLMASRGGSIFSGCRSLKKITVDENNPLYKCDGNCIIRKADNVLVAGCISSEIPDYVQTIGSYAFEGCPIRHIVEKTENGGEREEGVLELPLSIKTIDAFAFLSCNYLTTVQIPAGVTEIAYNAFDSCNKINSVFVGDNCNFTVTGSNKIKDRLFSNGGTVYTSLDDNAADKLYCVNYDGVRSYFINNLVPNCVLGEDNGMMYIDSFVYNQIYSFDGIINPYRSGYEFMGWAVGSRDGDMIKLNASPSGDRYFLFYFTLKSEVPKGTTLYAVWKPIEE